MHSVRSGKIDLMIMLDEHNYLQESRMTDISDLRLLESCGDRGDVSGSF